VDARIATYALATATPIPTLATRSSKDGFATKSKSYASVEAADADADARTPRRPPPTAEPPPTRASLLPPARRVETRTVVVVDVDSVASTQMFVDIVNRAVVFNAFPVVAVVDRRPPPTRRRIDALRATRASTRRRPPIDDGRPRIIDANYPTKRRMYVTV
jgi:hypothetical protein